MKQFVLAATLVSGLRTTLSRPLKLESRGSTAVTDLISYIASIDGKISRFAEEFAPRLARANLEDPVEMEGLFTDYWINFLELPEPNAREVFDGIVVMFRFFRKSEEMGRPPTESVS